MIRQSLHLNKATIILSLTIILISVYSCKKAKNNLEKNAVEQTKIDAKSESRFDCKKKLINKSEFEVCIKRQGPLTVKNSKGKIIYTQQENELDFEFIDLNEDGYFDILINYATNAPGHQDLLIYKPTKNRFAKVKSFYDYPNSKKIKNYNLYYSYHSNGCADLDWGSELYLLNGTKIHELGRIEGLGCLDNDTNGIYIYKINNDKEKLLNYIKRKKGYWNGKFDFIEKYWTDNKNMFK